MRLYKTSEYAIRALTYMALQDSLVSVRRLHEELGIPRKYLAMLLHKLARAGLVESIQGVRGGYRIALPRERITLADIIEVVEGLENYQRCILGYPQCSDEHPCPLHRFWKRHRDELWKLIHEVTLAVLAAGG